VRTTSLNRLGEKRLELPTGSPEEVRARQPAPRCRQSPTSIQTPSLPTSSPGRWREKIHHCPPVEVTSKLRRPAAGTIHHAGFIASYCWLLRTAISLLSWQYPVMVQN